MWSHVFLEHSVYRKLNKIDPCFDAIAVVQIRLRIDMYGALEMYLYCIVYHYGTLREKVGTADSVAALRSLFFKRLAGTEASKFLTL